MHCVLFLLCRRPDWVRGVDGHTPNRKKGLLSKSRACMSGKNVCSFDSGSLPLPPTPMYPESPFRVGRAGSRFPYFLSFVYDGPRVGTHVSWTPAKSVSDRCPDLRRDPLILRPDYRDPELIGWTFYPFLFLYLRREVKTETLLLFP